MNSENNNLRKQVTDYCTQIGSDSMLIQGAGGNVSWKDDGVLWIKASGTWLVNATSEDIFVPVDLNNLNQSISNTDFKVTPKVIGGSKLRPSIETLLHALMPHKIVVHVHAIEALSHLVRNNYEAEVSYKLNVNYIYGFVGYHKPGAELASSIAISIKENPGVSVLFLQNHGLVIGGDSIEEIKGKLDNLLINLTSSHILNSNSKKLPEPLCLNKIIYTPVPLLDVQNLALLPDLYHRLENNWALYPDHIVFLGAKPFIYDSVDLLMNNLKNGYLPELVFIKQEGVFSTGSFSKAKALQIKCYYDVLVRQPIDTTLRTLNSDEINELIHWDAEKYRQSLSKN